MFGQRPCDCDVIVCLTCVIEAPYLSFCLWRRWRRGLCCPDWPRPVCDARLWLALWLEACLWWRQERGSVFCPGSSVVSRGVGVRLQTESEQVVGLVSHKPSRRPVSLHTCLSPRGRRRWGGLSLLGQALPLLLQQLPDVRHLGGRRGFGSAVRRRAPDSVPAQTTTDPGETR